jgi:hypothetical protein
VTDLLFLAQESPHLHRVEGISLTAAETPGRVRVRFRYLTLVVDPAPPVEMTELEPARSLYSPERKIYQGMVSRDLLRPYVKRPPSPPPPGGTQPPGTSPDRHAPPGPESFRIVSLSEWGGQPEVHVLNLVNQQTARFKPGDQLAGGVIAMIDYRPLPLPGDPVLKSFSRVILKIGSEYWAIERGKTLADKYRLTPEQLPEQLARLIGR